MRTRNSNSAKTIAFVFSLCALSSTAVGAAEKWSDLIGQINPKKSEAGRWQHKNNELTVSAKTGARIALPVRPTGEYDFRVKFTRNSGVHSIALIFVAGGKQATVEIDAWGQHLAGIQQIGGKTLRDNATRVDDQTLENGRQYTAMVSVRKDRIDVFLNGKRLASHRGNGSDLRLLDVWRLSDSKSLGIGAWDSDTTFHSVEVRSVSGTPLVTSTTPNSKSKTKKSTSRPSRKTSTKKSTKTSRPRGQSNGRVLIVIANDGFFYREYADPRQELERAGFKVDVAAARKSACRPHANSGQSGNGIVQPDLAITTADASRYDALVFSGGWGSSMYQYAFQGSYSNRAYNGDRRTKEAANKLINDFVRQNKYVAGICHGVSVLAWSRINGKSLLNGRRATAPTRSGPAGIYNGRQAQPPSRWNSEVNGARLTRPGPIGNPRSSADDVVVDDQILTAEDDRSARELGRILGRLLKGQSTNSSKTKKSRR